MKKNSLLKLVSSICGVVAICGVFGLSLFSNKVKETSAVSYVIDTRNINASATYTGNYLVSDGNGSYDRVDTSNGDTTIYTHGTAYYFKNVTNDSVTYSVQFSISDMMFHSDYYGFSVFLRTGDYDGNYSFNVSSGYYLLNDMSNDLSLRVMCISFNNRIGNNPGISHKGLCSIRFGIYDNVNDVLINPNQLIYDFYINGDYVLPSLTNLQKEVCYNSNYTFEFESRYLDDFGVDTYSNFESSFDLFSFVFNDIENAEYDSGFTDGYSAGYTDGYNQGFSSGYSSGYYNGYGEGVASQQPLIDNAYNTGYNNGYADGVNSNGTAVTIFSGILQIGMLPINFFLSILNFEVFGINISGFIKAILTICLTIIVVKTILGNGGGGA